VPAVLASIVALSACTGGDGDEAAPPARAAAKVPAAVDAFEDQLIRVV
jgi:hypothetical protein